MKQDRYNSGMQKHHSRQLHKKIKLLFNPISGATGKSPTQLLDILRKLQDLDYVPEVFIIDEDSDLDSALDNALEAGIQNFLVCGGDGTIESIAIKLVNTSANLGILPKGTQNNIALSLGIPDDLDAAIEIFHRGQTRTIDVGLANSLKTERLFLETCSIGLLSALYPAADQIQHGDLSQIGDLLATLVDLNASQIELILDDGHELRTEGHVVLAANMPFVGPHFRLGPDDSYLDGMLDLIIFADLTKLELLSNVVQMADGKQADPRIHRYRVKQVKVSTDPKMPILADGIAIGEGSVTISI